ncbi:hypothetical protein PUNSTDRAFT_125204 [Punctularia strigosozonata HHB-11173 SS5]|uniref:uncharacterized protein n=1 Tax=Punctularia strigosozonata (strain HHB-11173) TaxID=741275 RepID=UPI0004417B0D|nr:uncharacterized protein PUNSTDRAFT_125204 [Punctularia strigosozonata HHB-11173 SS5]EIN10269.1 hypothetical protein PUNSTDRAFT_125204 [Punctularia strigosozonata HHB-11173 SS5]
MADWVPATGKHSVNIGSSVRRALKARKGIAPPTKKGNIPDREFYSFKWGFKPESIDPTKPGTIEVKKNQETGETAVTVERPSTAQPGDVLIYSGQEPAKPRDMDFVLIYDEATQEYTLEKIETHFVLNTHVRAHESTIRANRSPMGASLSTPETKDSPNEAPTPVIRREEEESSGDEILAAATASSKRAAPARKPISPPARPAVPTVTAATPSPSGTPSRTPKPLATANAAASSSKLKQADSIDLDLELDLDPPPPTSSADAGVEAEVIDFGKPSRPAPASPSRKRKRPSPPASPPPRAPAPAPNPLSLSFPSASNSTVLPSSLGLPPAGADDDSDDDDWEAVVGADTQPSTSALTLNGHEPEDDLEAQLTLALDGGEDDGEGEDEEIDAGALEAEMADLGAADAEGDSDDEFLAAVNGDDDDAAPPGAGGRPLTMSELLGGEGAYEGDTTDSDDDSDED